MTNETKKEVDIAEFKSLVESYHKILGLDIGSKRIGVAISTSDMTGALPLRTIKSVSYTHLTLPTTPYV